MLFDSSPEVVQESATRYHPRDAQLRANFCGVDVAIRTDSPSYFDPFRRLYRRFLTAPSVATPPTNVLTVHLVTRPDTWLNTGFDWTCPGLAMDGHRVYFSDPWLVRSYVYEQIIEHALARTTTCLPVHGAALTLGQRTLLLVGAGGRGKTTLALGLLQNGALFLGDDIGQLAWPPSPTHGLRVDPFLRSLRIRPDTFVRLGWRHSFSSADRWQGSYLVDVTRLPLGGPHAGEVDSAAVGKGAPLDILFLLENESASASSDLRLLLDGAATPVSRALARNPHVSAIRTQVVDGLLVVTLTTDAPRRVGRIVRALCREQATPLLDMRPTTGEERLFASTPSVVPVTPGVAAMTLLEHAFGTQALHRDTGSSVAHLSRALARVACYRLKVGPPVATCGLIEELAAQPVPA